MMFHYLILKRHEDVIISYMLCFVTHDILFKSHIKCSFRFFLLKIKKFK